MDIMRYTQSMARIKRYLRIMRWEMARQAGGFDYWFMTFQDERYKKMKARYIAGLINFNQVYGA